MQNWILTSVKEFYKISKDVLIKNKASFYIELGDGTGKYKQILITTNNDSSIESIITNGIENFTYRRFLILSNQNIAIDIEKQIYDQLISEYIIEGTGGRESEDIIECIYLRLLIVTKDSDKSTISLYKKLYKNLEGNINFQKGFRQGSSMHKKALYDIRTIHKIKRYSFNNPLSILDIKRDEETF